MNMPNGAEWIVAYIMRISKVQCTHAIVKTASCRWCLMNPMFGMLLWWGSHLRGSHLRLKLCLHGQDMGTHTIAFPLCYRQSPYWGEYPLGFAACLGQEECIRLLIAKGADPNLQDTNGNTVLHMLVVHDKKARNMSSSQCTHQCFWNFFIHTFKHWFVLSHLTMWYLFTSSHVCTPVNHQLHVGVHENSVDQVTVILPS